MIAFPKPTRKKRSRRDTGPDEATVQLVLVRDKHSCVVCDGPVNGERGRDWSVQHRRARGSGGSRRPDTNQPQNLLILCGSATTGCHGDVESQRADSIMHGWACHQIDDPAAVPVLWHGAWKYLTDTGEISDLPPGENETGWPEDEEAG